MASTETQLADGARPAPRGAKALSNVGHREVSTRSKLEVILQAATRRFGDVGFDGTKWADVAADVGIGPTALYHYFESKNHCLFVLVAISMDESNTRFREVVSSGVDTRDALEQAIRVTFDLSPAQVRRSRIIVAEQVRLTGRSSSDREEAARVEARGAMRVMETNWRGLITTAMADGIVEAGDPELTMRAVLGLLTSVWHWYRPDGAISLQEIADYMTTLTLRLMGVRESP